MKNLTSTARRNISVTESHKTKLKFAWDSWVKIAQELAEIIDVITVIPSASRKPSLSFKLENHSDYKTDE